MVPQEQLRPRCPELLPLSKRTGLKCSDHLPRFQKSPHSICSYYLFKEAHPIPNTYDMHMIVLGISALAASGGQISWVKR